MEKKMLELFAGTRRMADTFERHGFQTYTVELDKSFPRIDLYEDIMNVDADLIIKEFGKPSVIWASPVCTSYSVAAISKHRTKEPSGNLAPISDYARFSDEMVKHTLKLIDELDPVYFFIENPRGALRKMDFMQHLNRFTVTYCQYGETYQKPTDIWTNHPNPNFIPHCKRGMPCHEAAPRGAATGVQRLKNKKDKAKIPILLCEHIAEICDHESFDF
jgi:site-specific DNA-cytosine methylase